MPYFDDFLRDDYCDGPDFCDVNNPEIIFTMIKYKYIAQEKLVRLCIRYEHVGDSREKLFGVIGNAVGLIKDGAKFWKNGKRKDYGENITFNDSSTRRYLTFPLNNFNHPVAWKNIINSGVCVQGGKSFSSIILEFTKSNEFLGLNEDEKYAVNRVMKKIVEIENEAEIADVPTKLIVNLNLLENIPSLNEHNH